MAKNYNLVLLLSFFFIIMLLLGSLNNSKGFISNIGFISVGSMLIISFFILIITIFKNKHIMKKELWIYIFSILFILSYIFGVFVDPTIDSIKLSIQVSMVIMFFLGVTYIPIQYLDESIVSKVISLFIFMNFILWILSGFIIPYQGIFLNSNTFGAFIVFILGFFIIINHKKINLPIFLLIVMSIILVISSNSRTTLLVIIVSILTFAAWPTISKSKLVYNLYYFFFVIIIIMITVVYPNLLNFPLGSTLNNLSLSYTGKNILSGRQYIWAEILESIKLKPFLGHGASAKVSDFLNSSLSAHNYYLQMTLQVGILGSLFFFLLLLSIWNYFYFAKELKNIRIISSIFIGILIYQVFEVSFTQYNLSLAILQWLIVGFGVYYTRKKLLHKKL